MRSFFRAVFLGLVEFAAPRLAVGFGMPLDQWIADFAAWALSSPEIITRDQAIWGTMTIVGVLLSMLELWLAPAGRIFARMKLRGKAPPTASLAKSGQDSVSIDIDLTPSSGQRSDVRLSVKNNGALGTFSAQCQILAARNDPNQLKTGVFNLPWQADRGRAISISVGETQDIPIARWECWRDSNLCQLEILEWTTEGPTTFWDARWNMPDGKASLPEFDLEISITQQDATEPKTEMYMLRPVKYTGPLEMIGNDGSLAGTLSDQTRIVLREATIELYEQTKQTAGIRAIEGMSSFDRSKLLGFMAQKLVDESVAVFGRYPPAKKQQQIPAYHAAVYQFNNEATEMFDIYEDANRYVDLEIMRSDLDRRIKEILATDGDG